MIRYHGPNTTRDAMLATALNFRRSQTLDYPGLIKLYEVAINDEKIIFPFFSLHLAFVTQDKNFGWPRIKSILSCINKKLDSDQAS